mgnify:CR=1 FL=1
MLKDVAKSTILDKAKLALPEILFCSSAFCINTGVGMDSGNDCNCGISIGNQSFGSGGFDVLWDAVFACI